jgi:hypothetical protein
MLDKIENIKLRKLWELPEKKQTSYLNVLQCLKARSKLGKYKLHEFETLPYADVVLIEKYYESGTYDDCLKAMGLATKKDPLLIDHFGVVEFSHAWNYIGDQLEYINSRKKMLIKQPKQIMLDAGIEKLNMFGELNVLTAIAKDFSTTPFEVEQWPWGFVFTLQLKNKIESDIQDDLDVLMKAKMKTKK